MLLRHGPDTLVGAGLKSELGKYPLPAHFKGSFYWAGILLALALLYFVFAPGSYLPNRY